MAKRTLPYDALIFDVGGVTVLHDNERLFRRLAASCSAADAVDRIRVAAMDPAITTGTRKVRALYEDLVRLLGYTRRRARPPRGVSQPRDPRPEATGLGF